MNKSITIKNILEITGGNLLQGDTNLIFENLCKDTRELRPGQIYLGIKGENFNGSTLYEQALEKGAIACILQGIEPETQILKKYPNATIVVVENTVKALQQIAAYKRSLYNIPVIAITGSVGKTSTKDMVSNVVAQKYKVLKTQGNYNNEIGMPLTVLNLKDEEALVLEMGMNSFGEISTLTNIAKPDIAIITNIGTAHIGMLGSRENILKAKLEILEGLNPKGTVIINYDNDLLNNWYQKEKENYNILTYGLQEGSDILGKNTVFKEDGSQFEAVINNRQDKIKIKEAESSENESIKETEEETIQEEHYFVTVPVGGEHFISNSLCALAVAKVLQIPMEKALKGVAEFELTKKRMEMKKSKIGSTVINDCYNANYDSMKAAIEYLGKLPNKRKIAVLGDMLELGKYSEELHKKVGKEVTKNKIDLLICVGEESKNIAKEAKDEGMDKQNIFLCQSNEEAIKLLEKELKPEDVVLLKASNGLNFTQICDAIC